MQQHKADEIPHGFIQEGGVVILPLVRHGVEQTHPEEAVCRRAEGLPVEEVAPAAQNLSDEEPQQGNIQHRGDPELFHLAQHRHADDRADDAAIDGDASLPDGEHGQRVIGIVLPGEGHIVNSRAENGKGGNPQHAVQDVVLFEAEFPASAAGVQYGKNQPQADAQAVQVDGQRAQLEVSGRVHFQSQEGEGNRRIISRIHNLSLLVW